MTTGYPMMIVCATLAVISLAAQASGFARVGARSALEDLTHTAVAAGGVAGFWDVTVTLRACDSGAPLGTFRALNT